MSSKCYSALNRFAVGAACVVLALGLFSVNQAFGKSQSQPEIKKGPRPRSALDLSNVPYKIVHETYRRTNGKENWELVIMNADGSNPVNLTRTPDISEMYPHVSPDGTKISFVADEGGGENKIRNVYYMNIDGTGRVKVADNARQACWSPDGKVIAYLKGEFTRYTIKDYASKGIFFYNTETGKYSEHHNKNLYHLYNICWTPDGNWFLATVHGGMGFRHAILAIEANGDGVYDLTRFGVTGCRPDSSLDGKKIGWGRTDWDLCVAKLSLKPSDPEVSDVRRIVSCDKEHKVYHVDFSPDGKYIAFSYGTHKGEEMVGGEAPGWNICVSDMNGTWVQVTTDGNQNKEPDWVPIATHH
jgi:Tol biopolymer transport system component